jgi:hypothetical protein
MREVANWASTTNTLYVIKIKRGTVVSPTYVWINPCRCKLCPWDNLSPHHDSNRLHCSCLLWLSTSSNKKSSNQTRMIDKWSAEPIATSRMGSWPMNLRCLPFYDL